jgi:ankyrin repeat protein
MVRRIFFVLTSRTSLCFLVPFFCWCGANATISGWHSYQLLEAVWSKDHAKADFALDHGAWVDVSDEKGRTALIWAISANDVYLVQALLSHGARVNLRDSHGRTALTWTNYSGNRQIMTMLRKAKATY